MNYDPNNLEALLKENGGDLTQEEFDNLPEDGKDKIYYLAALVDQREYTRRQAGRVINHDQS